MPRLLRIHYPPKVTPGERGCIACHRPIVYGERCEGCKRELAKRRRRKPR